MKVALFLDEETFNDTSAKKEINKKKYLYTTIIFQLSKSGGSTKGKKWT